MKFSNTFLALGAVAFTSAEFSGNMFSKLAESAIDSSSWNFEAGEAVCSVYGDPHIITYAGAKINFKGTGEYLVAET